MPKMKTHSGANKRFRADRHGQGHAPPGQPAHYLEHKPSKLTRRLTSEVVLAPADAKKIEEVAG